MTQPGKRESLKNKVAIQTDTSCTGCLATAWLRPGEKPGGQLHPAGPSGSPSRQAAEVTVIPAASWNWSEG